MKSISVCMVVKDEAEFLEEALNCLMEMSDEIIVLDIGSTDGTKEIAKKYTEQVYDFDWDVDFSAAWNTAYSHATKDYIMFFHANEHLPKEEQTKLLELMENIDDSIDVISMFTIYAIDPYGNPEVKIRQVRIVKRTNNFKWFGAINEYLAADGNMFHSDIYVHHRLQNKSKKMQQNLNFYKRKLALGETLSVRDMFYYANELKAQGNLIEAIKQYNQFLNTKKGWIEDNIRACINMADCYRSLENPIKEVESLLRTISYDTPRPEVACRIGDLYMEIGMYPKAILWYNLALATDIKNTFGIQIVKYSTWYPHLQLCVCYWNLGNKELSYKHHLKVKEYLPNDKRVQYNETVFENIGSR